VKERGIIFQGEMVRAILAGRKTMTRRVVKPEPVGSPSWIEYEQSGCFYPATYEAIPSAITCPYGLRGDRLYVREAWANWMDKEILYRATQKAGWIDPEKIKWKPSIHMFKKDARIWLEITGIRVERVQEISEEDCFKEGIPKLKHQTAWFDFEELWDSINGKKYPWESNPWVWVIGFKVITP